MVRSDPRITPDRVPLGRFGRPEEIAAVAVMIASRCITRSAGGLRL
ncbi:MAG: hypothetical protein ACLPYS_18645 [Vulcanimicrobiaceae bacterium]